jgi:hypothetical protein
LTDRLVIAFPTVAAIFASAIAFAAVAPVISSIVAAVIASFIAAVVSPVVSAVISPIVSAVVAAIVAAIAAVSTAAVASSSVTPAFAAAVSGAAAFVLAVAGRVVRVDQGHPYAAVASFGPIIPQNCAGHRIVDYLAVKGWASGGHTGAAQKRSGQFDFGESLRTELGNDAVFDLICAG